MSLSPAEKESILQCDDEIGKWQICTYQSKVITKLRKAGLEPHRIDKDGAHYYKDIDFNRISFRNESKKREMTDEQRQKAAERLKKARDKNK